MPCWADGTTRSVADVSGAITRPSPSPAIARSVSQHRQGDEAQVVTGGEQVDGPLRDQVVAARGDHQADAGHRAVADLGGDPAAEQRADGQRDQEPHQQAGRLDLVHAEHALTEQLDVNERHHQRRSRAQRCAQRRQEWSEMYAGGLDQACARELLPHEERDCRDQCTEKQRHSIARKYLLAVRRRVVQAARSARPKAIANSTPPTTSTFCGRFGLLP